MGSNCSVDRAVIDPLQARKWPQSVDKDDDIWRSCRPSLNYMKECKQQLEYSRRKLIKKRIKKRDLRRRHRLMEAHDEKSSELLARISGRICSNGATSSACAFTKQGHKGVNQDAMVVWESFVSHMAGTVFCGVFDGHGPHGHLVARRVRDALPCKLLAMWTALSREASRSIDSSGVDDQLHFESDSDQQLWAQASSLTTHDSIRATDDEMLVRWRDSMLRCSRLMDKDLRAHPAIDGFCSGTTAVIVIKQGNDLIIGNIGDSRAVLGTTVSKSNSNQLDAVQLTQDLKPNLPKEEERIKRCKGRVFALADEPDVMRIWLPHDDAPGLAMARAFGDFCLKNYGLISVPDITYHKITLRDRFIVLGTDGVWDVLSNKEVVEVVLSAATRKMAARAVVEAATRAWRHKYPTSKADDCAVVCLFLDHYDGKFIHSESSVDNAKSMPESEASMEVPNLNSSLAFFHSSHHNEEQEDQEEEEDEVEEEEDDEWQVNANKIEWTGTLKCDDVSLLGRSHSKISVNWERMKLVPCTSSNKSHPSMPPNLESRDESNHNAGPSSSNNYTIEDINNGVDPSRCGTGECLQEDKEPWLALDGVARVNSLLTLPRRTESVNGAIIQVPYL